MNNRDMEERILTKLLNDWMATLVIQHLIKSTTVIPEKLIWNNELEITNLIANFNWLKNGFTK